MRKIFTKEEIDKWDSIDWQWAEDNYLKDIEEENKKFDILRLYIRPEFYFKENENNNSKNEEIVVADKNINQIAKDKGIKNTEFVISNINEKSVFDDEIPIIMEE